MMRQFYLILVSFFAMVTFIQGTSTMTEEEIFEKVYENLEGKKNNLTEEEYFKTFYNQSAQLLKKYGLDNSHSFSSFPNIYPNNENAESLSIQGSEEYPVVGVPYIPNLTEKSISNFKDDKFYGIYAQVFTSRFAILFGGQNPRVQCAQMAFTKGRFANIDFRLRYIYESHNPLSKKLYERDIGGFIWTPRHGPENGKKQMVFYNPEKKEMSGGKDFRIIKAGPEDNDGKYQYVIAVSKWNVGLTVLTRDVNVFESLYEMEVLDYLFKHGFNKFWNKPRSVNNIDCEEKWQLIQENMSLHSNEI